MPHANTASHVLKTHLPAADNARFRRIPGRKRDAARGGNGFSMLELLFVIAIVFVITCIALPYFRTTRNTYSINNDVRSLAGQISLARMRAAATFSRSRLYCDPSATPQCHIELQSPNGAWQDDSATARFSLSAGNSFGVAPSAATGAGGQSSATPQQPPNASSNAPDTAPYAVAFNSRGLPIDASNGNLKSDYVLYVQGTGMYAAVAVDASSLADASVYRYDSASGKYLRVQD